MAPGRCVILDLDGFKGYNDTYGHPAGDELLARLGGRLAGRRGARTGAAYRLGGDEFCVVARCAPPVQESVVAAARAALSETGEGFAVTRSAGRGPASRPRPTTPSTVAPAGRPPHVRPEGRPAAPPPPVRAATCC